MRKQLTERNLSERAASRTVLALSLAASLAAFGCTTNRTPGNGEPVMGGVGVAPASPTSGVTSGSSTGTSGGSTVTNPPMMSSSTHIDPLPGISTQAKRLPLTPDEAAAIMADNQLGGRGRVLGPANPGNSGHVYLTGNGDDPFGQRVGGIVTVNSSINSVAHLPAVVGGAGGGAIVGGTGGGLTGAVTVPGTGAATGVALTPTTATIPVTPGAFSAGPGTTSAAPGLGVATANTGTLTPTAAASVVPPVTLGSSGALTSTASAAVTTAGTVSTTRTAPATVNVTTGTATTRVGIASPVRVSQDGNGRVVVTNVSGQRK